MMTTPSPHASELDQQIDATSEAAAQARAVLGDLAADIVDEPVLADAELVLSELVANASEHGSGELIDLHLGVAEDSVELSVRNRSSARLPRRPWRMPTPASVRGRGLAVAEALATRITVHDRDGSVRVDATVGRA